MQEETVKLLTKQLNLFLEHMIDELEGKGIDNAIAEDYMLNAQIRNLGIRAVKNKLRVDELPHAFGEITKLFCDTYTTYSKEPLNLT